MVLVIIISLLLAYFQSGYGITILLDPARDSRDMGRIIDNNFERGISLQFVKELQKSLQELSPSLKVIVSSLSCDPTDRWSRAQYANCLGIDWYCTIHCYQQTSSQSMLHIYYFLSDPLVRLPLRLSSATLHFLPVEQAHLPWLGRTQAWAEQLMNAFNKVGLTNHLLCSTAIGCPFKPLCGINAPALALEIGLIDSDEWRHYMPLLAQSIFQSLHYMHTLV